MRAVHQFVPTYEPGAVGAHAAQLQRVARELGFESEIFAEFVVPSLASQARRLDDYGGRVTAHPDDLLVYQLCTGSVVADVVRARSERLVVNYHNITPVPFYARWEPDLVYGLAWGRRQLAALARRAHLGLGVSRYNEAELRDAGYRSTAVVPVLVDLAAFEREVDESVVAETAASKRGADWLFVGRISPNKAQHDLVAALAMARRAFDPGARLFLVGGTSSPAYEAALRAQVDELGLGDAVRLTGPVSPGALSALYRSADVLVSASEHEGFCVPLLEAMHHRVPVVAYAAAAVPETLRGASGPVAGLLVDDKAPAALAAAVARVLGDAALHRHLVRAGTARLADFSLERSAGSLASLLKGIADGDGAGEWVASAGTGAAPATTP